MQLARSSHPSVKAEHFMLSDVALVYIYTVQVAIYIYIYIYIYIFIQGIYNKVANVRTHTSSEACSGLGSL